MEKDLYLIITAHGLFTCNHETYEDWGDGLEVHYCPDFETPKEVADWVAENP